MAIPRFEPQPNLYVGDPMKLVIDDMLAYKTTPDMDQP